MKKFFYIFLILQLTSQSTTIYSHDIPTLFTIPVVMFIVALSTQENKFTQEELEELSRMNSKDTPVNNENMTKAELDETLKQIEFFEHVCYQLNKQKEQEQQNTLIQEKPDDGYNYNEEQARKIEEEGKKVPSFFKNKQPKS